MSFGGITLRLFQTHNLSIATNISYSAIMYLT